VEHRLKLPPGSVSLAGIKLLGREENRRAFAVTPLPGAMRRACSLYVEFFIAAGTLSQRLPPDALLDSQFVSE